MKGALIVFNILISAIIRNTQADITAKNSLIKLNLSETSLTPLKKTENKKYWHIHSQEIKTMKADEELTIHILRCISEIESENKVVHRRYICPCVHDSQAGPCIRLKSFTWQEVDYKLKMLKYLGFIQGDDRKDPLIGISFTCLSAAGRSMITNYKNNI